MFRLKNWRHWPLVFFLGFKHNCTMKKRVVSKYMRCKWAVQLGKSEQSLSPGLMQSHPPRPLPPTAHPPSTPPASPIKSKVDQHC